LKKHYDLKVKHTYFPLHPEIPSQGLDFADFFNRMGADGEMIKKRLKSQFQSEGLPGGDVNILCNTRLAQELAKWAETEHPTSDMAMCLFTAYFGDGANISDIDTLVGIAEKAGLPIDEARSVLENRSFEAQVDSDWQRAREMGVNAVPTYLSGEQRIVGFQPYERFEQVMEQVQGG
jgi:predicted DsbA family dithiol-disulfide isomerase